MSRGKGEGGFCFPLDRRATMYAACASRHHEPCFGIDGLVPPEKVDVHLGPAPAITARVDVSSAMGEAISLGGDVAVHGVFLAIDADAPDWPLVGLLFADQVAVVAPGALGQVTQLGIRIALDLQLERGASVVGVLGGLGDEIDVAGYKVMHG